MVKDAKIYIIGLKKDLFGCFRIEEIRDKDNETGLKEGGGIEMSIYSAFHIRDARSLSLLYFTYRSQSLRSFVFHVCQFLTNVPHSIHSCCSRVSIAGGSFQ